MGKHRGHVPVRTCVSCRTRMSKQDLVRMVLDDRDRIVIDRDGKGKGRGIYICRNKECMDKLSASKAPNRLFRVDRKVSIGFTVSDKG